MKISPVFCSAFSALLLPLVAWGGSANTTFDTPQVKVTFKVDNDWGNGFEADVAIKNKTTKPLKAWQLTFNLARDIVQTWNAGVASHSGDVYEFNASAYFWNQDIPANGSVSFGFLGSPGGLKSPPTDFGFSAQGTTMPTPTPTATPIPTPTATPIPTPTPHPSSTPTPTPTPRPTSTPTPTPTPRPTSTPTPTPSPTSTPTPTPSPTPSGPAFSIADATVQEPASGTVTVNVEVTLSESVSSVTGVTYQTQDGSAKSGSDYAEAAGTLLFEPGTTEQAIPITIYSDTTTAAPKNFTVDLTQSQGAAITRSVATVTISANGSPAIPFGSRMEAYAAGTIRPSVTNAVMDSTTTGWYQKWKTAFFLPVGTWQAIYSNDADYPYVAEEQGYGLEIFALMAGADPDAQTCFDAVLKFILDHPSSIVSGLMASEENKNGVAVDGQDSATDGDLAIAYGLLMADRQWGSTGTYNYKSLAISRINAIKQGEVNPKTYLMLLGDWDSSSDSHYWGTRPSDFMIDHFRAFRAATGDTFWDSVVSASQKLITTMQQNYAPSTGLIPDFVVNTNTTPKPAPANFLEADTDGDFSWNSVRVPWRIGTDAAIYGDATSKTQARMMTTWIKAATGGDASKIMAGYTLSGSALVNYPDVPFTASFAIAAMLDAQDQTWLDSIWPQMVKITNGNAGDTYGACILMQCLIVVGGNYWAPALVAPAQ